MSIRFSLTVSIDGDSLQQIDDGLVEAAGQRLMARIQEKAKHLSSGEPLHNKDAMSPTKCLPPHLSLKVNEAVDKKTSESKAQFKKNAASDAGGVSEDSSKSVSETSQGAEAALLEHAPLEHAAVEPTTTKSRRGRPAKDSSDNTVVVAAAAMPPAVMAVVAQSAEAAEVFAAAPAAGTREDAVKALTAVNSAKGIDAAKALLTKFEVKRLSELDEKKIGEFIAAAEAIAK